MDTGIISGSVVCSGLISTRVFGEGMQSSSGILVNTFVYIHTYIR